LIQESILVVGLGEIGRPLFELIVESKKFLVFGLDIKKEKLLSINQNPKNIPSKIDIMHICIPYKNHQEFLNIVNGYIARFKPKLVIINSTVSVGTTKKIFEQCDCLVAHSPVRGVHRDQNHMKWEIKHWTKYVGGATQKATQITSDHFKKIGLNIRKLKSSTESELAKLFETTYRAWMITCFQEMHRISKSFSGDFDDIVDFLEDTHRKRFDRPIMFPDYIGGHCLIPNTKLLLDTYDSELLKLILKSNERRLVEIKDEDIKKEIKKINERAINLQKELMDLIKVNGV
jgi:UDP-N-acetyl-D-mannosaminuronate dehydrogenase